MTQPNGSQALLDFLIRIDTITDNWERNSKNTENSKEVRAIYKNCLIGIIDAVHKIKIE